MFPRTIGEHNSLGICVSQVGGPHNTRDMWFLGRETHITRDMCFPGRGIDNTRAMCFLAGRGTHITRAMCFPGRGTQITS